MLVATMLVANMLIATVLGARIYIAASYQLIVKRLTSEMRRENKDINNYIIRYSLPSMLKGSFYLGDLPHSLRKHSVTLEKY